MYDRIVFIGENGSCREAMAAAILEDIGLKKKTQIMARGLVVLFPEPLNQKAEAVMISNGLPTEGYMTSPLKREDMEGNTLSLVMEGRQREKIMEMFEGMNPENVQILSEFVGDEIEVMNPYGGSLQMYGLCYETLYASIKKLANLLNGAG